MPVLGGALGSFGVASFEPRPHTLIVTVGETLGKIVRLLIEARKEGTDRLLVSFAHSTTMARGPSTSKRGRADQSLRGRRLVNTRLYSKRRGMRRTASGPSSRLPLHRAYIKVRTRK